MKRAVGALLLALAAACDVEPPTDCPTFLPIAPTPSLEVSVVDSVTGHSLLPGARGRWILGTATDSLYYWGETLAGFGPAGRYAVVVEAPGYQSWARGDIRVRRGECGPVTEQVTARLRRE